MKKFFTLLVMLLLAVGTTSLFSLVKVGEEVCESFQTEHPYRGGNGVTLEKVYHWPNAGYISIHFSKFDLAPGDYLEITNPEGTYFYVYNGRGKAVRGGQEIISEFWATHIPGDTAVVRLHSRNPKGGFGFEIDKWVRGYEQTYIQALLAEQEDAETEAICSSDDMEWAKCYEGTTIYEKGRAVARLLMNGSSACTGWLLGSEGHVMTNNHCVDTQSTADNTDYEFMAEGATCATSCASWLACPGTVEATSGTLVKTDYDLDYSLILLPTNITSTYGYLQMRNELPAIGERIYIPQHASAWAKQFAVLSDVDGGYCDVYSTNQTPCHGGPGDIGYYCDTAGGSSGSPVLAYSDHLVVSLHHCATCPNRGVPIPPIITHMGTSVPANAIGNYVPPDPVPPAAPSNLTGTPSTTKITLNWSDNSNNETGFNIYRGPNASTLTLIATVGANTTSYIDSGLPRRTTYYYKVCAYNALGETCSGVISVKTK